jgi:hypothetical protein
VVTCHAMRFDRTRLPVLFLAFVCAFALSLGNAFAGGSISYARKEIQESNGGWHLMMTIVYGGKPNTAHVPMRFTFTPVAFFENYLDDAHGDKPQKRKIPLVGQLPINESVDVDFADSRGKMFDRTRFDFTISRAHNFSAGEYTVAVHRADGAPVGATQTLTLQGDNPVIDRRAISFVAAPKKDKDKDKAAPAADAAETKPAGEPTEAPSTVAPVAAAGDPPPADPSDPAAAAKVPPGSHGCGCRAVGANRRAGGAWAFALGLGVLGFCRLRRRRLPV